MGNPRELKLKKLKGSIIYIGENRANLEIYHGEETIWITIPKETLPVGSFYGMPIYIMNENEKVVIRKRRPEPLTNEELKWLESLK